MVLGTGRSGLVVGFNLVALNLQAKITAKRCCIATVRVWKGIFEVALYRMAVNQPALGVIVSGRGGFQGENESLLVTLTVYIRH